MNGWHESIKDQQPDHPDHVKKPGLKHREAVVRGDEAGLATYDLQKGESVSDFTARVASDKQRHRNALKRQQNVAAGKPAMEDE